MQLGRTAARMWSTFGYFQWLKFLVLATAVDYGQRANAFRPLDFNM